MKGLRGVHAGETATIVGSGPSLLHLTAADFGPGPVIMLNDVVRIIRRLGLPNPLYLSQKDGCIAHDRRRMSIKGRWQRIRLPLGCVCPDGRLIPPVEPETLLLSAAESPRCFTGYPRRHVIDVERDLSLPWHTPSAPVAVRVADVMGCTAVRMLAHDAYTSGDERRVYGDDIGTGTPGYWKCGDLANREAIAVGLDIQWVAA